jgi:CBS domain-containing protein
MSDNTIHVVARIARRREHPEMQHGEVQVYRSYVFPMEGMREQRILEDATLSDVAREMAALSEDFPYAHQILCVVVRGRRPRGLVENARLTRLDKPLHPYWGTL